VTSVSFGTTLAEKFSNGAALLDCGTTNEVVVTTPIGKAGTKVKVTLTTVESDFTGSTSNSVSFTYTASSPSAPTALKVTTRKGRVTVTWSPPRTDGGHKITKYIVRASSKGHGTKSVTLGPSARSYTFAALQHGVPWTISVLAVSSLGDGLPAIWGKRITLT
jgi:fibronectin type 3 domain-containing protein